MFIIEITYKVPPQEIDKQLATHMAYLDKYYRLGYFIASGRQEPRTGGIILAKACSREMIEAIINEDPFKENGIADYRIIDFKATKKIKGYDEIAGEES
jgi:uncharacterized protein YciI